MANINTKIEWTDATWSPVTGCTKVSQGCKNCYAERLWPKVAGAEAKRTGDLPRQFTDVRCHPERLDAPLRWRKPRRVFVNSMSDIFHERVPFFFIDRVFSVMLAPERERHTFQILTKRPTRMREYFLQRPFWTAPAHIWLGVSVEDQATADERIPLLLQTPAAVRFVSYEPALGPIKLKWDRWLPVSGAEQIERAGVRRIDWLIAGGESGPGARPAHPEWFRSVRDQCAAASVAFFFKQWGEWEIASRQNGHHDCDMARNKAYWVHIDGALTKPSCLRAGVPDEIINQAIGMIRVGKKKAGRLLDGREHSEWPACQE